MECTKTAICPHCSDTIANFGELCLDACILACSGVTDGNLATFNPEINTAANHVVCFLERKGILLTTEISQLEVAYVPTCQGIQLNDNAIGYCWCIEDE